MTVCSQPEECCRELSRVWAALGPPAYTGRSCHEYVEALLAQRDALAAALRRIAADETECGCSTHDDDENDEREGDCCNVVGVYCAHCIAGAALALVETPEGT